MREFDDTFIESLAKDARDDASRKSEKYVGVFPLLLFAFFVIALLMAIIAGTSIYRSLSNMRASSNDARLGLNLIANSVRASDASGSVAVGTGPEGRSLVLVESMPSGTYETRIYRYQGSILEEYSLAGSSYTPGKATRLTGSQTFGFSYKGGLLTVTTDQGSVDIALRNLQGGA